MLPKGGELTRRSIAEYVGVVRGRCSQAAKKAKTGILNDFVATTCMYRKSVSRLLNGRGKSPGKFSGLVHSRGFY